RLPARGRGSQPPAPARLIWHSPPRPAIRLPRTVSRPFAGCTGGYAMLRALTAALVVLGAARAAPAQAAWRFRWQAGQVLTYPVEQQTRAVEVVGGSKSETKTKLSLIKRWKVLAVDAAGVATLQHSLDALRLETVAPHGH